MSMEVVVDVYEIWKSFDVRGPLECTTSDTKLFAQMRSSRGGGQLKLSHQFFC